MTIEFKVVEGGVAMVALDRPEVRNALNLEMCEALIETVGRITADPEIKLVFVRGNGPVFCGGADLNERKGKSEEWIRERRMRAFAAYGALESLPMPCVALVHGAAIGSGVEIAAACDFIVATPGTSFRTPEAQRGTVGATQRLPRILGKRLAKDLMFTGRALTADEARTAGFVARVVEDLHKEASVIAEAILKASPLALTLAKRTIDRGVELDPAGALQSEIEAIEAQLAAGHWMGKT
ncbi:MAG TPA: enoyl-CoA hydratase/isomerase family protein [Burkholderiales bacterium]|nr:enoyl-CoA hydratase/isomerase family protein [Burkholderiales bacterium]